jgi:hypothetical protein
VNAQRNKIKQALEALVEAQRHRDVQRLAMHLAKRQWPELCKRMVRPERGRGLRQKLVLAAAQGVKKTGILSHH